VWAVASGSVRHDVGGMEGFVTSLAFSRDGKTLASGCSDTTVLLWDLNGSAEKVETLKAGDLDALWKTIEGTNAKKAEEAMRKLAARPAEAVPYLTERLKPVPGVKPDKGRIAKLIAHPDRGRHAGPAAA